MKYQHGTGMQRVRYCLIVLQSLTHMCAGMSFFVISGKSVKMLSWLIFWVLFLRRLKYVKFGRLHTCCEWGTCCVLQEEIRDLLSKDQSKRLELKERPDTGVYVKVCETKSFDLDGNFVTNGLFLFCRPPPSSSWRFCCLEATTTSLEKFPKYIDEDWFKKQYCWVLLTNII